MCGWDEVDEVDVILDSHVRYWRFRVSEVPPIYDPKVSESHPYKWQIIRGNDFPKSRDAPRVRIVPNFRISERLLP